MTGRARNPVVAVLGASGLIGEAISNFLLSKGYDVVPVARRFTATQIAAWGVKTHCMPLVEASPEELQAAFLRAEADVIVNCIGALQDTPGSPASEANRSFVKTMIKALKRSAPRPTLLVHVSIPGRAEDDVTGFSRAKREAEALIAQSGLPFVIMRPGFVLAEAAFGGSALMRALAVMPFDLPRALAQRPFAVTDARDIGRSVAAALDQWQAGRRDWRAEWDIMEDPPSTVGGVLAGLAQRLGGPKRRLTVPNWLLRSAAVAGDVASQLGWRPAVRSTALCEMERGVTGDPTTWRRETGLEPLSGPATLAALSATVQERWFARLYILKALIFPVLVIFWLVSGGIALTVAFEPAMLILTDHGFGQGPARAITIATSLMDITIGLLILHRRSCQLGLLAGIALSLFYMLSAAIITPNMWIEPLGALVKTGPSIILMMVALAVLDNR